MEGHVSIMLNLQIAELSIHGSKDLQDYKLLGSIAITMMWPESLSPCVR